MRLGQLVAQLRALGVELSAHADKLKVNAPKGALTPELVQQLRDRKAELLAFLKQGEAMRGAERPPLRPLERDGPFPLSYSQQRVWFIENLGEPSALFNGPAAFRLRGPFDLAAMRRGILEIIRRHSIMRTAIEMRDNEPVQVVSATATIDIPLHDMAGDEGGFDRAMEYLAERTRIPFALDQAPLFRAELIQLGAEDHILFFMPHHIIWDGWSFDVFLAELKVLYEAFHEGRPSPLPDPPVQYSDFTVWQRDWLEGGELEQQLAYWRQQLAGELPVLAMPTDFARPPRRSSSGGRLIRVLSQDFADQLTAFARAQGATLYMALLAAYKILLCRYTGQQDILVGAPMAGNAASETEHMVGFFVNTIVLRTDLSGDPSYREVLRRVQQTCVGAFSNQDVPFEKLVECIQPLRDLSRTPIHQTEFGLQEASRRVRTFGPLELEQVIVEQDVVGTDLIFWVKTDGDCLPLAMDYSTTLFAKETVEHLLENLETLLMAALAAPDTKASELPLVSDARQLALRELGRGPTVATPSVCVHDLIEQRAVATPDAVAVVHRGDAISYGDLDRRANQLAHYLVAQGVIEETFVGVCLERGIDMVMALLAIHKAGGAYLPLDPAYPHERLSYMLQDSSAAVVLTTNRLASLVDGVGAQCIRLDEIEAELQTSDVTRPAVPSAPERLAYVIYTSGSTGGPKGVLVEHRNVTNFLTGMADVVAFQEGGTWLAVTSISFDISVLELFGSLAHGFTVVLYDGFGESTEHGEAIADLIASGGVTHLQCTPSQARMLLLDEPSRRELPRLQQMLVGGEALPIGLASELRALCPSVVNVYGPTEATVWSTWSEVLPEATAVAIGKPLANQQVYVLDANLRPVPRGVTGELYIGGAGVVRGYLNRPEQTAERFLDDPFAAVPGGQNSGKRMYRTGDLAYFDLAGELHFKGRVDSQIKLRGHRIELGEIEQVLRSDSQVDQAVVVLREDVEGDQRLVAYITPAASGPVGTIAIAEVKERLSQRLPEFMIPTSIVALEQLPLTPNGKVDRLALPEPTAVVAAQQYVPTDFTRIEDPAHWWWRPVWKQIAPSSRAPVHASESFLVFLDQRGVGQGLVQRLRARGHKVTTVALSDSFSRLDEQSYALNPEQELDGYSQLVASLEQSGQIPTHIVHLWMLVPGDRYRPGSSVFHHLLTHGFESLVSLARVFGELGAAGAQPHPVRFTVCSSRAHAVLAGDAISHPEKSATIGACAVLPRDHAGQAYVFVDLDLDDPVGSATQPPPADLSTHVAAIEQALGHARDRVLACRRGQMHELSYESSPKPPSADATTRFVPGATYLVVGALDDAALAFVGLTAKTKGVRIVMVDKRELPTAGDQQGLVLEGALQRAVEVKQHAESLGAQVTYTALDCSNPDLVRDLLHEVRDAHGPVRGVFHSIHMPSSSVDGDGAVSERNVAMHGLRSVASMFAAAELDFYVVSKSADLLLAPPGRANAAAVAAFADAWAASCTASCSVARAVGVVTWGPWHRDQSELDQIELDQIELDQLPESVASSPLALDERQLAALGLTLAEAREALALWFAQPDLPNTVVSSVDVQQLRRRMAELANMSVSVAESVAPRDDIESKLHKLWSRVLQKEDFGIRDDFFDLGGHSLMAAMLFHQIRLEFQVDWPLSRLFEAPDIEKSAALLRESLGREPLVAGEFVRETRRFRYLVPMHAGPKHPAQPIFLLGGMFGNVLNLRHLGRLLGETRPVYAIQARGLLGSEEPHSTYEEMAADYLAEVRSVQPHGPYFLCGFCSGGTAAFEMAQQLVRDGEEIALLAFLDAGIPNWPSLTASDYRRIQSIKFREGGAGTLGRRLVKRLRWEAGRLCSWFRKPTEPSLTEFQSLKMRAAFLEQSKAYIPGRLPGSAVLMRPKLERRFDLGSGRWADRERVLLLPDNGWTPYVENLEVMEVGGDHDGMILEPHVRALAHALRLRMEHRAQAPIEASSPTRHAKTGLRSQ